jgi:acrylyl-CoA reductase (NADPH)
VTGGIDVAGIVAASADPRFAAGDQVLATGFELGVTQDGGFAEYTRVRGDWLVPVPQPLTLRDAMSLGTAGLTVALSIIDLERNGVRADSGPIAVTGASGGVGSLAVDCLSQLGYEVTAVTGKRDAEDYLRALGARDVISREALLDAPAPLAPPRWAGAIDPAGGDMLAALLRAMRYGGVVANCGLTAGAELHTTVMPFILRGVKVVGIDSVQCPMPVRRDAWRRLATDMRPRHLSSISRPARLDDLDAVVASLLAGSIRGRTVVQLGQGDTCD